MRKNARILSVILIISLLLSGTAFADTVVLADRPFGQSTANGTAAVNQKTAAGPGTQSTQSAAQTAGPGTQAQAQTQNVNTAKTAGPGSQTQAQTAAQNVNTAQAAGPGSQAQNQSTAQNTQGPGQSSSAAGSNTASGTVTKIAIDSKIEKPSVYSETAVLYDATLDQILFEKDAEKKMYPASTTKLMTALLSAERLKTDEVFTFTDSATKNLESGYTNVSMVTGDRMTVKDALFALLLKSACEVANGLGEAVSGSQAAFSQAMNKRALELGCKNTNFTNASGLNDSNHVTTAYDLALIAKAAFANETVREVCSSKNYTLPASLQRGQMSLSNSNKMLYAANDEYVAGIIGGKTGYTSKAGNTLVEVANIEGHELIAVVMKSNSKQYVDSKALFAYGDAVIKASKNNTSSIPKTTGSWEQTKDGWKYRFSDGTYAKSEWADIGQNEYYFNAQGIMATGWKQFTNGAWYYFNPSDGSMVHDKWVTTDGQKYYYLQSNGVMASDTVVNGIYRVDANGVYVEKVG